MSLPVPFKDFIPRAYWDDPLSDVLATKADEHLEDWKADICNLSELIDPARIPAMFLDELGYYLNADLLPTDSERTKREKVWGAVEAHKRRGSWTADIKPKIDAIVGGNAVPCLMSTPTMPSSLAMVFRFRLSLTGRQSARMG